MPLTQRVPKLRGFHNRFRVEYQVVNCGKLARFEAGAVVDGEGLCKSGLVRHPDRPIKLLAGGGAPPKLTVRVNRASRAALELIAKAGGTVELLDGPKSAKSAEAAEPRRAARRATARVAAAAEDQEGSEPGAGADGGGQESSA
jgi:hypothetical protein